MGAPMHERDLLVIAKKNGMTGYELALEVANLQELLYHVECPDAFCKANDIIDLNRYKIISKPHLILQIVKERTLKPFVFIMNKN